ncbi:MAG: hypothetical protein BWY78_01488 [Alphaproteobacteria bacterium ADurb.Bin438]|nr:MAG: hypothetical protein BWY78_01488 [Alphaproteobacteria bacterium ADurb.Bin438]
MLRTYEIGRILETPFFKKKDKIYISELKKHAFDVMERSKGSIYIDVGYSSIALALKKRDYLNFDGEAIIKS